MFMDGELTSKFLELASKIWLPDELLGKIKEQLSSWGWVSVTKVTVSWPKSADVDKMSEQEAKDLLKKLLDEKSSEWKEDWCEDWYCDWWKSGQKPENPLMRAMMKNKF